MSVILWQYAQIGMLYHIRAMMQERIHYSYVRLLGTHGDNNSLRNNTKRMSLAEMKHTEAYVQCPA